MLKGWIFCITACIFLAGCSGSLQNQQQDDSNQIDEGPWVMQHLDGPWLLEELHEQKTLSKSPKFMLEQKNGNMKINGNNGCNSFFGFVEWKENRLVAKGPIATTRKLCQGEVNEIERELMWSLEQGLIYQKGKFYTENGFVFELKAE